MGVKCPPTFSAREGHVRICEPDENGFCVKNCRDVRIEDIHPRVIVELKRLENAWEKYS